MLEIWYVIPHGSKMCPIIWVREMGAVSTYVGEPGESVCGLPEAYHKFYPRG